MSNATFLPTIPPNKLRELIHASHNKNQKHNKFPSDIIENSKTSDISLLVSVFLNYFFERCALHILTSSFFEAYNKAQNEKMCQIWSNNKIVDNFELQNTFTDELDLHKEILYNKIARVVQHAYLMKDIFDEIGEINSYIVKKSGKIHTSSVIITIFKVGSESSSIIDGDISRMERHCDLFLFDRFADTYNILECKSGSKLTNRIRKNDVGYVVSLEEIKEDRKQVTNLENDQITELNISDDKIFNAFIGKRYRIREQDKTRDIWRKILSASYPQKERTDHIEKTDKNENLYSKHILDKNFRDNLDSILKFSRDDRKRKRYNKERD